MLFICIPETQPRENVNWTDTYTTILSLPCVLIFLWCWQEQFKTNIIFANMRKDKKSGKVITEDHGIPHGRMFEMISSPHRMCEVIMYTVLVLLIPTKTFFCIYLWVLGNQVCSLCSLTYGPFNRKLISSSIYICDT